MIPARDARGLTNMYIKENIDKAKQFIEEEIKDATRVGKSSISIESGLYISLLKEDKRHPRILALKEELEAAGYAVEVLRAGPFVAIKIFWGEKVCGA